MLAVYFFCSIISALFSGGTQGSVVKVPESLSRATALADVRATASRLGPVQSPDRKGGPTTLTVPWAERAEILGSYGNQDNLKALAF